MKDVEVFADATRGEAVEIRCDLEGELKRRFALFSIDGELLATAPRAALLSHWAFARGAERVVHLPVPGWTKELE